MLSRNKLKELATILSANAVAGQLNLHAIFQSIAFLSEEDWFQNHSSAPK